MNKILKSVGFLTVGSLYFYQLDPRIKLEYSQTPEMDAILSKCPSFSEGFFATPWLFNGIFQALYGGTIGSSANTPENPEHVVYEREFIRTPDDGLMSIDWKSTETPQAKPSKILLIAPGLTGGSHSCYIRCCVNYASSKGYKVGVLHGRGIGGTPLRTLKIHHLCAEDDYAYLIKKIHKKYPDASIVALGTSMGAGLLLKYAAQTQEECLLKAVVAVAAPFDYIICRRRLNHWWPYFGFSDGYIVKSLMDQMNAVIVDLSMMQEDLSQLDIDLSKTMACKSSQAFDENFTIRVSGYDSTEKYYKAASVDNDLHKISVPTLALSSEDDPIVSYDCVPVDKIKKNPNLVLAHTRLGGHVSFYSGFLSPYRWYPIPCIEFLDAVIQNS